MALRIIPSHEKIDVGALRMLITGQPGAGKSSAAFTASKPLCFDFDRGAHRSAFRKDIVPVDSWKDAAGVTVSDISAYDTIIIDTVGRALDFLSAHIIAEKPKMGTRAGALSIQGYGELKAVFTGWVNRLTTMGKDVIFLAHDKEERRGEDTVIRPDIQGGSYGEIFKQCDGIAYLSLEDGKRTLDFSHRNCIGKNPGNFQPLTVPDFNQEPDFMANLIADTKSRLGQLCASAHEASKAIEEFRGVLAEVKNADGMNAVLEMVNKLEGPVQYQAKTLMHRALPDLGIQWDADTKSFIASPQDNQHVAEAATGGR